MPSVSHYATPAATPAVTPAGPSAGEDLLVGVGAVHDVDLLLDLGPLHPSAHGALRLALRLDGDRIVAVDPRVGALHRGAEKLFEVRDYRQVLMLADRHDWLSAFASELPIALAAESLLGMQVPARATWARTLLAELTRVSASLAFLAAIPAPTVTPELGASPGVSAGVSSGVSAGVSAGESAGAAEQPPPASIPAYATAGTAAREAVLTAFERATGGRIHLMANRVGGLEYDLSAQWLAELPAVVSTVRAAMEQVYALLRSPQFHRMYAGIGVLDRDTAIGFGVSGPVARASGVDTDLRRDEPLLAYPDLGDSMTVVTRTAGDAAARLEVLADQVEVSLRLALACAQRLASLPAGVALRLPKVLRVPVGATYVWTEAPLGVNGCYLVSRGDRTPWRCKLRTPSFAHAQALPAVLTGARLADLTPILASMFFVIGDIDR